ncbi:PAS domain S-box protein [Lacipirellula limnantheis]|uniref:histidine kinase n=1 Tax=Lacipirellula limnantheis TaxID=2528024 RepID=A0A517U0C8_9BACT|nr:PAS domain S-box protein [Lacipirellula limnantheis]QDT74086.1 Sensor protein FixL [Lacipirellula limnantheis]
MTPHESAAAAGPVTAVTPSRPFDFTGWNELLHAEHVFVRVDLNNKIDFVSASVRDIMGYRPEDLIGRDYRETFDLDHPIRTRYLEVSDRFAASDPPNMKRTVGRRANGSMAFLWTREREIVGENGLIGREFMIYDATRRVETLLSLRQSERKYRRLVEGLRTEYIIYSRDARGMITYVSPSVKKVLGFEPEEMIGTYARDAYADPSHGRQVVDEFARASQSGKLSQSMVIEVRHRDGAVRQLEINERPVFAADGKLASVEGICKDVTEAVAAERQIRDLKEDLERRVALRTDELQRMYEDLRASEARYRDVVETLNDFVVRWKPDGTRDFVNEAFARFHNVTPADLIGTSFVPTIHVDDQTAFQEALASISPQRPSATYEIRVRRRDGSYPWVQWNTRATFDEHGELDHYQSVGRDVTALKAAADMLRQKEVHLAHLSRLATMGEMVAGIAHEINQPLHAAKTFAEAARRHLQAGGDEKLAKAIECTGEISEAITRTVQIIRRLREFTKAQPFELEALSLNDVVREAAELAGYEIRHSSTKLKLELADELPVVLGDRIQLEQLVVNLLMNGCEAMEQTALVDRILVLRTEVARNGVCLTVTDAGVGVADDDMHRLFDAFYTTKEEGMGMGLVLCKSIAEAHGGHLRAERNASPGMTFALILPATGGN